MMSFVLFLLFFFFFKQKTAYEMLRSLVGSEMCIRDRFWDPAKDRIMFDQGKYIFEIGTSSKDIRGKVEATMSGTYNAVLKTVVAECGSVVLNAGNKVCLLYTSPSPRDS